MDATPERPRHVGRGQHVRRILSMALLILIVASGPAYLVHEAWMTWLMMGTANIVKQHFLGFHNYHDNYKSFPSLGALRFGPRNQRGWMEALLPYMDQTTLHSQIDLHRNWNAAENRRNFTTRIYLYECPTVWQTRDAHGYAVSHYAGNVHLLGVDTPVTMDDIGDGLANTTFAGQAADSFVAWGSPENLRDLTLGFGTSENQFGCPARGLCVCVCVDGGIRTFSQKTDLAILKAFATPNGSESLSNDW